MPVIELTAKSIDALKPAEAGQVEYWDLKLPGFGIRLGTVNKHGRVTKTWQIMYRLNSRQRRYKIGRYPQLPLADARDEARKKLRDVELGIDPAEKRDQDRSADNVRDLCRAYIKNHAKIKKRSWKEDKRIIDRDIIPKIGSRKASTITKPDIIKLINEIRDRPAPIMANRTLSLLRKIFNWGIANDYLTNNPTKDIPKPGQEKTRERVLTNTEIRAIWTRAEQMGYPIGPTIMLLFYTAARSVEIATINNENIDDESLTYTVPSETMKGKADHRIPLAAPAFKIIGELRERRAGAGHLLVKADGEPTDNLAEDIYRFRKPLGFHFTAHDIRRTVATRLSSELEIPRFTIERILDHADDAVAATYDRHSYDREKKNALEAWARRLNEILQGQPSTPNVVKLRDAS